MSNPLLAQMKSIKTRATNQHLGNIVCVACIAVASA